MSIKDTIRAEIERNRKAAHKAAKDSPDIEQKKFHEGKEFAYRVVEILIDSLPEQPMEGLEEEIVRYLRKDHDRDTTVRDVARHFAEWGAKHAKL